MEGESYNPQSVLVSVSGQQSENGIRPELHVVFSADHTIRLASDEEFGLIMLGLMEAHKRIVGELAPGPYALADIAEVIEQRQRQDPWVEHPIFPHVTGNLQILQQLYDLTREYLDQLGGGKHPVERKVLHIAINAAELGGLITLSAISFAFARSEAIAAVVPIVLAAAFIGDKVNNRLADNEADLSIHEIYQRIKDSDLIELRSFPLSVPKQLQSPQ
jgi:hypothetical protein